MNENLQEAVATILTGALKTAEQAKEFVLSEMPDLVQQLLQWEFLFHVILAAGFAILGTLGVLIIYKLWPHAPAVTPEVTARVAQLESLGYARRSGREDRELKRLKGEIDVKPEHIIPAIFALLLYVMAAINAIIALKIHIAPKLYLLEYTAELLK